MSGDAPPEKAGRADWLFVNQLSQKAEKKLLSYFFKLYGPSEEKNKI